MNNTNMTGSKTGEKHTEGPWTIQHGVMAGPDGKPLGACSGRPDAEAAANMALIAASPTAHKILSDLREWFSGTAPLYGSALIGDSDDTIHVRILKYFAALEGR